MKGTVRLLAWCLAIALVALPVVGLLRGWFAASRWPVTQLTVVPARKRLALAHAQQQGIRPALARLHRLHPRREPVARASPCGSPST